MGVGYILINSTKKEAINFYHLPASKMKELAGNNVTSAIVTWYMLNNRGDNIRFIPDSFIDENFDITDNIDNYLDVTSTVIKELINEKIIRDDGFEFIDEDEPQNIYIKRFTNIWMDLKFKSKKNNL